MFKLKGNSILRFELTNYKINHSPRKVSKWSEIFPCETNHSKAYWCWFKLKLV